MANLAVGLLINSLLLYCNRVSQQTQAGAKRGDAHEQLLEAYINKWLIVGYDTAGNLIEVAYNIYR
jgi:hypothetical protein